MSFFTGCRWFAPATTSSMSFSVGKSRVFLGAGRALITKQITILFSKQWVSIGACRNDLEENLQKLAQNAGKIPEKRRFSGILEVMGRFELPNDGFADRCLTTWLHHHMK